MCTIGKPCDSPLCKKGCAVYGNMLHSLTISKWTQVLFQCETIICWIGIRYLQTTNLHGYHL